MKCLTYKRSQKPTHYNILRIIKHGFHDHNSTNTTIITLLNIILILTCINLYPVVGWCRSAHLTPPGPNSQVTIGHCVTSPQGAVSVLLYVARIHTYTNTHLHQVIPSGDSKMQKPPSVMSHGSRLSLYSTTSSVRTSRVASRSTLQRRKNR